MILLLSFLFHVTAIVSSPQTALTRAMTGYKNVAYFPNWAIYGRNFHPQDLNASSLTHVLYAFANIHPETGEVYLSDPWSDTDKHYSNDTWEDSDNNVYGCIKQLFLQKKRNRKLKVLLSIGGWTYSSNFAVPASTAEGRSRFANSAVQLLQDLGFDGLDIDWEYPENEIQADDMVSLLQATRQTLDEYSAKNANGTNLLLTVASPAGPTHYSIMKLAAMDQYIDFWNLMGYDYAGSFAAMAGHTANLKSCDMNPESTPFNTQQAISYYKEKGISASKIILGMPLYGRSFADTYGPGTAFSADVEGTWEPGVYDYKDLPHPGASMHSDDGIVAAWSYDSAQRLMVSFETPGVTKQKAKFIASEGLGGGMWWESSGDKQGDESLISTFVESIGGISALDQSENLLSYPASKYSNIRAGMTVE
ncbi:glycoside hydrolase [Corynespora cassiicola Philippines]|uniref:chitinase n=1 Tax=Corynespora cassiicola Philippines TaxID=1448308 RepID=A0A2T2N6Q8_CORCC|nr:glycoside hydrolase [Corynespora cassiicola Philippines]